MKLVFSSLIAIFLASLTSCQSISTQTGSLMNKAGGAAKFSKFGKTTPVKLRKGMTKEQVVCALGKASYQYALPGKEVWIYEDGNLVVDKAKETALNMVPVVGPAASLLMDMKPCTEAVRATVCFNCKGKVIDFTQSEGCVYPGK